MQEKKNPYLLNENFYAGYQESIDDLKNKPEMLELDKLIYLVFRSDDGKKLLEVFNERFVMPSLVPPGSDNYSQLVTYFEGFKEAFRFINTCLVSHEQRIKAERDG
jgi:hypothetical protein